MKVIYKQPTAPSQKKKVIDIHKYAKSRNRWFRISLLINIILLGACIVLSHR